MFLKKAAFLILLSIFILALPSCASVYYAPDEKTVDQMSVREAIWTVRHDIRAYSLNHYFKLVTVSPKGIAFWTGSGSNLQFLEFDQAVLRLRLYSDSSIIYDDKDMKYNIALATGFTEAKKITDAIFILKTHADEINALEFQLHMDDIVKNYLEADPKPIISEETRKYFVMAQAATKAAHFDDAADYYYLAEVASPWWPDAHYNRAITLEALQLYMPATVEMKYYLMLSPNDPNVRKLQDKIYAWQSEAQMQQQNTKAKIEPAISY